MIRSNSNSAKAINLVAKNFNLTAKEISHRNWCEDGPLHIIFYTTARKKLRLFKVGRGKRATWKQKARMQGNVSVEALTTNKSVAEQIRAYKVGEGKAEQRIIELHHPTLVNNPPHYTAGGIETIDFIEAKSLGYNLGNVVKYITRADHKGDKHEDLCKARWYLNREIAKLTK
jgi:hypothetical protein